MMLLLSMQLSLGLKQAAEVNCNSEQEHTFA